MRGAGVSGLSAIPPKRENIIRPLIEVTREEVLEYLQSSGFEYVSDPSNAKPVYTRNRIRLEVLPVLKQFNSRIIETLAAEAALFRDEDEALEGCLAAIAAGVITQEEDGVVLQREKFNALPQAFRRRLLRNAANRAGAESSGLSFIQIDEALAFMAAARTGRIMRLPYGLVIEREYEKFIICLQAAAEGFSYALALPGVTAIPELGMQVETMIIEGTPAEQEDKNYFWQALFDCDKIGPLLTLRSRRPGDRFRPAGMGGGSKKLQDYFVDMKIPRRKRDTVPLLVAGDDILWVAGLRTDERFLARADTKKILVIRMRKAVGPEPETAP
jgi:tRNA(Ile)-lysidine synthase